MSQQLVTLQSFDTAPHAQMAAVILLEAGIPVFLENTEVVTANWAWGNAVGYVKLRVPQDFRFKAEQLLAARAATPPLPENACLSCGAKLPAEGESCLACGWSFATPPDGEIEYVGEDAQEAFRFPLVVVIPAMLLLMLLVVGVVIALMTHPE